MKFKLSLMVTALVSFALGSAHAGHAATPPDACSLLTPARVSSVLRAPIRPPIAPSRLDCMWIQAGAAAPGKGKGVLLAILGTLGPDATAEDRFNAAKKGGPFKGTPKTVSGIGDDAVYSTGALGDIWLYVKKGASVFKIRVRGFPPQETQEKEKALALDILAKL